jgi:hypothetical protein
MLFTARVQFEEMSPTTMRALSVAISRAPNTFCLHAKMMLLCFETMLRLVISSFNLPEEQETKAGDSFWWVDLPLTGREPPLRATCHYIGDGANKQLQRFPLNP